LVIIGIENNLLKLPRLNDFYAQFYRTKSVISFKCFFSFVCCVSFLRSEEAEQAIWP